MDRLRGQQIDFFTETGLRRPLRIIILEKHLLSADVAELVDAHVSGACAHKAWEFDSPRPHHIL